jgi:hypothetical protein
LLEIDVVDDRDGALVLDVDVRQEVDVAGLQHGGRVAGSRGAEAFLAQWIDGGGAVPVEALIRAVY